MGLLCENAAFAFCDSSYASLLLIVQCSELSQRIGPWRLSLRTELLQREFRLHQWTCDAMSCSAWDCEIPREPAWAAVWSPVSPIHNRKASHLGIFRAAEDS